MVTRKTAIKEEIGVGNTASLPEPAKQTLQSWHRNRAKNAALSNAWNWVLNPLLARTSLPLLLNAANKKRLSN